MTKTSEIEKATFKLAVKVKTPQLPNFVRLEIHSTDCVVDVADIGDDDLKAIGAQWTDALIELAAKRRINRTIYR